MSKNVLCLAQHKLQYMLDTQYSDMLTNAYMESGATVESSPRLQCCCMGSVEKCFKMMDLCLWMRCSPCANYSTKITIHIHMLTCMQSVLYTHMHAHINTYIHRFKICSVCTLIFQTYVMYEKHGLTCVCFYCLSVYEHM